MFEMFKRKVKEKVKEKVKINKYTYNVQTDISAYELFVLTRGISYRTYKEQDAWYDALPDLTKRHIKKTEVEIDKEKYV